MLSDYLRLNNEEIPTITDDNFSDIAIEYITGVKNCDAFFEELENLPIAEEIYNPTVDECFKIIENFMIIGDFVKEFRDALPYFEKAIEVMDGELQIAVDYNEIHNDNVYAIAHDYLNSSEANYAYAQKMIFESLIEVFDIDKNSRKEILAVYKRVTIPNYEVIKKIIIDDEEFLDIREAQEHINNRFILEAEEIYYFGNKYFNIRVVLADKIGIFELDLDITDAYDSVEISEVSLLDVLLNLYDFFEDELPIMGEVVAHKYIISLDMYKKGDVGTVNLDFIYPLIYKDMDILLKNALDYNHRLDNFIVFVFDILESNYKKDIDILCHVINDDSETNEVIRNMIYSSYNFTTHRDCRTYELYNILMFLKLSVVNNSILQSKYSPKRDRGAYDIDNALASIADMKKRCKIRRA